VAARRTYQAIRAIAIVAARQIVAHQIERAGSSVGAFARLVCMWQASLARFPAARHGAPVPEQEKPAAVLAGLFGHGRLRQ